MAILRIQHTVPDFVRWKEAFDSDPAGRQGSGVLRFQVLRALDDPNFVMIDLEFASRGEAESLLAAMRGIWSGPGAAFIRDPQAWIVEPVETKVY